MRLGRQVRVLAIGAAVAAASALAALVFGPSAAGAKPRLIGSVAFYWGALSLAYLLAANWRRRRKQILASALSCALAFVALEIVLRALLPFPSMPQLAGMPSRELHHVYRPNARMFNGYAEGSPLVVRTNEDGLRTEYSRAQFLSHKTRVAVLGDSFIFGSGVPQECSVPMRLESALRERMGGRDIAVLNAGVISYAPFLEMLQFEKIVRHYRPDICLMVLDAGDIGEDWAYSREFASTDGGKPAGQFIDRAPALPPYRGAVDQLFIHPYLVAPARYPFALAWPSRFGYPPPEGWPIRIEVAPGKFDGRWFHFRNPPEVTRPYFELVLSHVRKAAEMAREIGCRFVFVAAPRYPQWNLRECPARPESGGYGDNEPYQFEYLKFFDEASGREAFEIFGLLPAFKATTEFPLCFPNDPHWNRQGCDFVARTLADYLIRKGDLDAPPKEKRR